MPLSISRLAPRRAPTTEIAPAYAHTTNAARRRNVPSDAMAISVGRRSALYGRGCGLVLRWTLGHDAVLHDVKSVGTELALQDDFSLVLERIGNDAGIGD